MTNPLILARTVDWPATALNAQNTPAVDYPATALLNGMTYDRWRAFARGAGTPDRIWFGPFSGGGINYVALAGHNLNSSKLTGVSSVSVNVYKAATLFGALTPIAATVYGLAGTFDDVPVWVKFAAPETFGGTYDYLVVEVNVISATLMKPVDIGVMYWGAAIEMEHCLPAAPFMVPSKNRRVDMYSNDSENGQFVGRYPQRRWFETDVSFPRLTRSWVDSHFTNRLVLNGMRLSPFFFIWNPDHFQPDIIFGTMDEDLKIGYTGDRDRISVSWKMRGLGY